MSKQNYLQKYVARKVRHHRKQQGLSQEKLSEMADLGLKYVNYIENESYNPKLQTLDKIITALGMTPEEFFDFSSLEGKNHESSQLALKRVTMKIKQLPEEKRKNFLAIFEAILDNID